MKLTRLRLLGFKSFVEPTDFLIEPGLTGVVGPNGCGKSNLVEALRWVMGETSHKSLRAADMDDVIFAGTNNRPVAQQRRSRDAHRQQHAQGAGAVQRARKLDVSRRIERDKGSTYRINGREVRARDVQILFADASTGSRSPALVHQGRIGEIIQAKPEQRRRVLEEAAGISGLHARRHEAELRLRAAEQNLAAARRRHQPACRADGVAQDAGAPGGALPQYRGQVRTAEATLFHLRWVGGERRTRRSRAGQGPGGARWSPSAPASRPRPPPARRWRRPNCRRCAKPRPRPPPACSGWSIARETLEQEETRAASRMAELDQPAGPAWRRHRTRAPACGRRRSRAHALAAEEEALKRDIDANAQKRTGAEARVAEADAVLAHRREDLRRADRHARRPDRPAQALEQAVDARMTSGSLACPMRPPRSKPNWPQLEAANAGHPDLAALALAAEEAQASVDGGGSYRGARRGRAFGRPPGARRRARSAGRSRAPRATPRHRSQDAGEAPARRHQESVAGGDRRSHGREGLRGRARRRARRRSRSAGRSVRADALGRRRDRSRGSARCRTAPSRSARMSRRRRSWRAGSRRSASSRASDALA